MVVSMLLVHRLAGRTATTDLCQAVIGPLYQFNIPRSSYNSYLPMLTGSSWSIVPGVCRVADEACTQLAPHYTVSTKAARVCHLRILCAQSLAAVAASCFVIDAFSVEALRQQVRLQLLRCLHQILLLLPWITLPLDELPPVASAAAPLLVVDIIDVSPVALPELLVDRGMSPYSPSNFRPANKLFGPSTATKTSRSMLVNNMPVKNDTL